MWLWARVRFVLCRKLLPSVDRPQNIEDTQAMRFFGGEKGMPTLARDERALLCALTRNNCSRTFVRTGYRFGLDKSCNELRRWKSFFRPRHALFGANACST